MTDNRLYHNAPAGLIAKALPPHLKTSIAPYLWITENATDAEILNSHLQFFHPKIKTMTIPAWDCLPYDRISPKADICARRMAALAQITNPKTNIKIIIAPLNATLQRLPPKELFAHKSLHLKTGQNINLQTVIQCLNEQAYERTEVVRTPTQYSLRGSLLDIFSAAEKAPCRIDLFGDTIDKIRYFDPISQLSTTETESITIHPAKEIILNSQTAKQFQNTYRKTFGAQAEKDPIFIAIQNLMPYEAMEHWMPCFYETTSTLFDYAAAVITNENIHNLVTLRQDMVNDHCAARQEALKHRSSDKTDIPPYRPMPAETLYLNKDQWNKRINNLPHISLYNFAHTDKAAISLDGKISKNFAYERNKSNANLFNALKQYISEQHNKITLIACTDTHAEKRMQKLLQEHNIGNFPSIKNFSRIKDFPQHRRFTCQLPLAQGFNSPSLLAIAEADIFGDKNIRKSTTAKTRHSENFIREISALNAGDLAVHEEHGVGRFLGLRVISVDDKIHECAELEYADNAKLLVPVENIEMLSRYGGDNPHHPPDRLGQTAWQARKAKVKKRLKDMSEKLLAAAAKRAFSEVVPMRAQNSEYEEFAAAFPFSETQDQTNAIDDVIADLAKGKPMDRLICGDTGFGKTEVVLRAAFINAMHGGQTAIIAPTTLLARQHYINFKERFSATPVNIKMLSRLNSHSRNKQTKIELADGSVDIVIGTHALLQKSVQFKNLTLAVIDEEQHFGVKQKQRLKENSEKTHILALSATPIPRTMQMALHGIQDMSIIATPPIDRLATHSFNLIYDPVTVRDAILRERLRGGQFFAVVPRIADIRHTKNILKETLPDLKMAEAHGQMPGAQLENIIASFINQEIEGLLSTNIIESGIDIPNANTMLIFRAEMFSLAQLYQLRGRIGRSNRRAYCYMITPADRKISENAKKRLEIMQTLDNVGAGFTIASYDLDIRGAGNLLGEEQSGHIKEVGVELFQKLLKQAVRNAKERRQSDNSAMDEDDFSPVLNLGVKVIIPEDYISDLSLRLNFYRRLAHLNDTAEIQTIAAEMQDRFGKIPPELELLCSVTEIKINCKNAKIAKINASHKGATLYFHKNKFGNVSGLVEFIETHRGSAKMQPDHSLAIARRWSDTHKKLNGIIEITKEIARIASDASNTGEQA